MYSYKSLQHSSTRLVVDQNLTDPSISFQVYKPCSCHRNHSTGANNLQLTTLYSLTILISDNYFTLTDGLTQIQNREPTSSNTFLLTQSSLRRNKNSLKHARLVKGQIGSTNNPLSMADNSFLSMNAG